MKFNLDLACAYETLSRLSSCYVSANDLDTCKWMPGIAAISKTIDDGSIVDRWNASFCIRDSRFKIRDSTQALQFLQWEIDLYRSITDIFLDPKFPELNLIICQKDRKTRVQKLALIEEYVFAFGCRWGWSLKEVKGEGYIVDIPGEQDKCFIRPGWSRTPSNEYCFLFVKSVLESDLRLDFLFDR
jgi:hypothetical protein